MRAESNRLSGACGAEKITRGKSSAIPAGKRTAEVPAMKKLLLLLLVVVIGWFLYTRGGDLFVRKPTIKSHRGTATLFMDAALAKNPAGMKTYCTGAAVNSVDSVLSEIQSSNPTFARYSLQVGGVSSGDRVSGQALCYGAQGDLFLSVLFTVERQGDNWFISELGTRSYQ